MVSPEKNNIITCTIERLQSISGHLGKVEASQAEVLKPALNIRLNVVPARYMIWVSEHPDIWMQIFKVVLRVLV